MVNKYTVLKALHVLLCAMFFCSCQQTTEKYYCVKKTKMDLKNILIHIVSIELPFLFYPEWWYLNDNKLYVLNSRVSPFLTIYNLSQSSCIQDGYTGNAPKEFIVPSLCEMKDPYKVEIYSNSLNKLEIYHFRFDSLSLNKTFHFPL